MGQFQRVNGPTDPRAAVRAGAERGVYLGLEHLLGVAKARVPHDEKTLRDSGATAQDGTQGVVAFDTPYAVRQHEEMDWYHPRGGQAKYLESAMGDERTAIAQLAAQAIRKQMGG
ncbi:hypothetical protein [Georgenia faecalis]|uniref:hypothetical protein n=1 Tax=Georgenia faecalis TaxID=2483799 RepID=UPI000FDC2ED0|nr:hypothetical protein [Georgenia faecalis]